MDDREREKREKREKKKGIERMGQNDKVLDSSKGQYLIQFRYTLLEFLLPELDSVLELLGLAPDTVYDKEDFDPQVPFLRVRLESDQVASAICERCILIKGIYQVWGAGRNYDEVCDSIREFSASEKNHYCSESQPWCIAAKSFGYKFSQSEVTEKRERLLKGNHGMKFKGRVKLKGERNLFWIIEHVRIDYLTQSQLGEDNFTSSSNPSSQQPKSKSQLKKELRKLRKMQLKEDKPKHKRKREQGEGEEEEDDCKQSNEKARVLEKQQIQDQDASPMDTEASVSQDASLQKVIEHREVHAQIRKDLEPEYVFFAREVARPTKVTKYTLKKRTFLGPTSMENEMAFLMATQGLARKGSLILDPFVGTGSILVPCAVKGAVCFGSEIDYLTLKGKNGSDMFSNFDQYELPYPEIIRLDFSPRGRCFREAPGGVFDAIICDPPYGIRAGARKVGTTKKVITPIPEEMRSTHIPPTQPYDTGDLMVDLVDGAARLLKQGGRLVYLLPVIRTMYSERVLPQHDCLQVIANSEQQLRYPVSRRLITMKKVKPYDYSRAQQYVTESRAKLEMPSFDHDEDEQTSSAADAIKLVGSKVPFLPQ